MKPTEFDDAAVQAKWVEIAPLLDRMMERSNTRGEFPVGPGSSLAGDDMGSNPYQVSHVLRLCLTAAVDHLHAVKMLVVEQQVLHVAAPSSLARGALENLSAAYWILGPSTRDERIQRTLRWHAKNFKDGDRAAHGRGVTSSSPLDEKLQKLDRVAHARGLQPQVVRRGYTSTEAVTFSNEAMAGDMDVLFPWQLCSGFAHGRPWAYLGASDKEVLNTSETGVVDVRMTSSLGLALYPTLAAMRLMQRFLRLYETRSARRLI